MIRLIRPYVQFSEVEAQFRAVFESGTFTRGTNVEAFADDLARYTGSKHAFLTTSATTALSVCLKVLGVGPGDEVVVSDFSFPASANVVEDLGAKPVFADVAKDTFNTTADEVSGKLSAKTRAVMFVDALGNPSGVTRVADLCRERKLPLIEDAACAIGSSEHGVPCGRIADLTCFSFHPRKLLTTGEGGAITTEDPVWAEKLKVKLAHGGRPGPVKWDFVDCGFNFRMSELQAVMGRVQLAKLDDIVRRRNRLRQQYVAALEPMGYLAQVVAPGVVHNVQSMVFVVPEGRSRDALVEWLRSREIETTLGTYSLSSTTYYRQKYGQVQSNAAELEARTITLPCYDDLDWGRVVEGIAAFERSSS